MLESESKQIQTQTATAEIEAAKGKTESEARHYREVNISLNARLDFLSERLALTDREKLHVEQRLKEATDQARRQDELAAQTQTRLNATIDALRSANEQSSLASQQRMDALQRDLDAARADAKRVLEEMAEKVAQVTELRRDCLETKGALAQRQAEVSGVERVRTELEQQRIKLQAVVDRQHTEIQQVTESTSH